MSDLPSIDDLLKKNKDQQSDDTQAHVSNIKVSSSETGEKFDKKMKDISIKEKERDVMRFGQKIRYPHIDLAKIPVTHEALRQIPKNLVEELGVVCFYSTPEEVRLGAIDPTQEKVQDLLHEVEESTYAEGSLYVISENSLERVLKLYDNLPNIEPISKDVSIAAEDLERLSADVVDFSSLQESLSRQSATDLLILLLGSALKLDASDLHIETEEEEVAIRLRLDGILHDAAKIPKTDYKKLISRIKLVSSIKLNIADKPQDGRFTIKVAKGDVDVRVSTMPTVYGESVVMRLLHQSMEGLNLDSLGLQGSAYVTLKREIERPNGMVITTGPTGSGKTTTMYSIMQILNKPGVKIITLEDPVEYKMAGINQSQVEVDTDYTFAKGLKSILRQDPDIAMVGEIRDLETAETAIQAALTGHLILSTIHTNDAAGVIPRFLSMGVKAFLLTPALNCVIGQRLVRRTCEFCKEEVELDAHTLERVGEIMAEMPEDKRREIEKKEMKFFRGVGCEKCGNMGYKGRIGIYEVFAMTSEIEQMILAGRVSENEIEKKAIENGMITMVQDGILKALEGITAIEEVFRVTE